MPETQFHYKEVWSFQLLVVVDHFKENVLKPICVDQQEKWKDKVGVQTRTFSLQPWRWLQLCWTDDLWSYGFRVSFWLLHFFITYGMIIARCKMYIQNSITAPNQLITLHSSKVAAQCIVIGLCVCVFVVLCVCGSVTTITRNCVHWSSPNWVCR